MKATRLISRVVVTISLAGVGTLLQQPTTVHATTLRQETKRINAHNKKTERQINALQRKINQLNKKLTNYQQQMQTTSPERHNTSELAALTYRGENEVLVNNNQPSFSATDLATDHGGWQTFSNLDALNRVGAANVLLNQSMMPTAKREGLTWNPTGWHNKRIKSGWLYNRSHLIGYQLTGENNNPKNLMTGTRQLNAPEMLAHESDIAYYLKKHPNRFVRYRVTPILNDNELLARGVQMEGQSVGDNSIQFNTYIFNVQDGVTLNYADGTSQIAK